MKIGYIRVSKHEQNEALQRDALIEAGCEKYFSDVITGSKFERKGLEQLLAFASFQGILQITLFPIFRLSGRYLFRSSQSVLIYKMSVEEVRSGANFPGLEPSIPMIGADFLHGSSKSVEV